MKLPALRSTGVAASFLAAAISGTAWSAGDITDGLLDPSFDGDGKLDINIRAGAFDSAHAVAVAPDGKIYLVGGSYLLGDPILNLTAIVRLNGDGTVDKTYDGDGIATFDLESSGYLIGGAIVQSDGKLLFPVRQSSRSIVCRVLTDGNLDLAYGGSQTGCHQLPEASRIESIALQPDGYAVVAGYRGSQGAVYRLDPQGHLDANFANQGEVILAPGQLLDIAVAPDGKLVVVGRFQPITDFEVFRLHADGGLDFGWGQLGHVTVAFDQGISDYDRATAVSVLSDGSILVAGDVNYGSSGHQRAGIAKLDPITGALVDSFAENGKGYYDNCPGELGPCTTHIEDMFVQSDGRIVMTGYTERVSFPADFFVLRVFNDGYVDTEFGDWWGWGGIAKIGFDLAGGGDTNTDDFAFAAVNHGGRILVAGRADVSDGSHFAVARLTNDRIFTDDYDH